MVALTLKIERHAAGRSAEHHPRPRWRRALALATGVVLTFAALGGVVAATASVKPTPSVYSAITQKQVLSAKRFNAGHVVRVAVTGGKTGVPKAATSVQLVVTVAHGTAAGTLDVYPNGRSASPMLHWRPGQTVTTTVTVRVGTGGKVAFRNVSHKVTVTAGITGYYTPALVAGSVTAGDLSSSGATTGQVLTNTSTGPAWTSPTVTYTVSPTSADFLWNSLYIFETSTGSYTEYFTRYYNMSVPALTQAALDNGSVQVFMKTAPVNQGNQWLPLPYQFDSSFGYTYNFTYVTSPGQVQLEFYLIQTDPSATLPTLSTMSLNTYTFKVVVTPGLANASAESANVRVASRASQLSCRPFPGGRTCTAAP
jgi:hypothetical protein